MTKGFERAKSASPAEEASARPTDKYAGGAKQQKRGQAASQNEGTAAVSSAALNAYIQDFLKDPTDETYDLLEPQKYADAPAGKKPAKSLSLIARHLRHKKPSLFAKLVSALIEVESQESSPETLGAPHREDESLQFSAPRDVPVLMSSPEEEPAKTRKHPVKSETLVQLNKNLAEALAGTLIREEDMFRPQGASPELERYQSLLKEVVEINNRNRERVLSERREHFAHFALISILSSIDASIEALYQKRSRNKKKQKEDDGFFKEMEELLDKRATLAKIFPDVPFDFSYLPQGALSLEDAVPLVTDSAGSVLFPELMAAIAYQLETPGGG